MSKFMIIFMVFIPFQVISLKMMIGDEVPVPVASVASVPVASFSCLDHGEGIEQK